MPNSEFKSSLKTDEKDLIPLDPVAKCLWVMKVTSMSEDFAIRRKENNEDTEKNYLNYNHNINAELGYLEYDLRNGKIDKEEFSKKSKEIYEKYDLNFDILKQNLDDLEKSKSYDTHFKENYEKYNYDRDGKRIPSTEAEIEAEKLDNAISNRLKTQTEKYFEKLKNKENEKSEDSKEQTENTLE